MKICVTSTGDNLDAPLDPRFGRCGFFIIVDTETMEFEAIENPNVSAMGGAGVQSAQLVANQSVKTVITGNAGPNAFHTLNAAGIEVMTGASGSVKDAVEQYKSGQLKPAAAATTGAKSGMGGGQGRGMGRGRGRQGG